MRKITSLLMLCLMALGLTANAQTAVSAETLNALTEATDIQVRNISPTNRWYFCGDKNVESNTNAESVLVWEPVGDGNFYLKKKNPTGTQGEGYLQTSAPSDMGAKATAQKFTAVYAYPTDAPDATADATNLVRFSCVGDNVGKWINCQGTDSKPLYNSGAGAWTMHNVYLATSTPEPEPTPKEYRIKDVASGKYMNASNYDAHPTGPLGGVQFVDKNESDDQIFTFEADGENYKLKTKSGKYIYCQSWNVDALAEGTSLKFVDNGDGTCYIMNGEKYFKVEYVSGKPVATIDGNEVEQAQVSGYFPYCDAASGAAAKFIVEEITVVPDPAPEVAEPINDIAQLSNFKAYTATLPNHQAHATGWAVNTTDLKSIVYDLGLTQKNDDPNQQFAFLTPDEGATYYLYSVGQSKYISNTGKLTESPTHPIVFKNGNRTGTFVVWFDKNHIANVGGSGQMAIDGWGPDGVWGNADDGNSIVITPVDDFDPTDALSKFVTSLPDPIKASDFAAEKVYVIKNVSNSRSGYLYVGGDNALCIGNLDDLNNIPNNYQFKSMPTNSGLVLKAVEGGYVPTGDGSGANLSATTVSEAAVVTVAAKGGTFPETTLNMLVNGNYCNVNPGALCTWNDVNDPNGVWEFYAIEEIANVDAAQMTTVTTLAEQALTLDGVGYPVASERENLNNTVAAAKAFNTSGAWYKEMVNTLTAYAATENVKMPEDGKAYTFKNVQKNGDAQYFKYDEANGITLTNDAASASTFICRANGDTFTFVTTDGKFLTHKGNGSTYKGPNNNTGYTNEYDQTAGKFLNDFYVTKITTANVATTGNSDGIAVTNELFFGYVGIATQRHDRNELVYYVLSNTGGFDQAVAPFCRHNLTSMLRIDEVEFPNKPVVNDAAGVENVAAISTFCAPFATVAPNNVEVYIAASDESHYIKLQKVEGAVPANTGVVLVSTDDAQKGQAVTMVPATTETLADVTGNLLRGDAAKGDFTVGDDVNAYVLGKVDDVAGFYPLSAADRKIKQGKAYLVLDETLSAVKLYFGGDEATGIETVVKENANAPIFDLSGRRVVNVAKGGIYIQNGKKFIVK